MPLNVPVSSKRRVLGFHKAMIWVKDNCQEGEDLNRKPSDRERKDWEWETVVKMTFIPF